MTSGKRMGLIVSVPEFSLYFWNVQEFYCVKYRLFELELMHLSMLGPTEGESGKGWGFDTPLNYFIKIHSRG